MTLGGRGAAAGKAHAFQIPKPVVEHVHVLLQLALCVRRFFSPIGQYFVDHSEPVEVSVDHFPLEVLSQRHCSEDGCDDGDRASEEYDEVDRPVLVGRLASRIAVCHVSEVDDGVEEYLPAALDPLLVGVSWCPVV